MFMLHVVHVRVMECIINYYVLVSWCPGMPNTVLSVSWCMSWVQWYPRYQEHINKIIPPQESKSAKYSLTLECYDNSNTYCRATQL